MDATPTRPLRFPFAEPPEIGGVAEIAPGVLWLRLALPYALDHVNVYLFEEPGGWAVFDTGIGDDPSRDAWQRLLDGVLGGRPITRLVVSHFHPDHVGLAGWLGQRFAMPLHMAQTEYLYSRMLQLTPAETRQEEPAFYRSAGLSPEGIERIRGRGKGYLKRTTGLAPSFERLSAGETLALGGRSWRILTGGGHAPEQVMLWCEADRLFLAADQVLARISPNVSVTEIEPHADPLGRYLASLAELHAVIDDGVLVLPGHNLPFWGLHERAEALADHHAHRCGLIAEACRTAAPSCLELVPVIFRRRLDDPHQLSFALGEALAHLNYMLKRGALVAETDAEGVLRYRAA